MSGGVAGAVKRAALVAAPHTDRAAHSLRPPSQSPITHIGTARSCSPRRQCPRPHRVYASLVPGPPSRSSESSPALCLGCAWNRRRLQGLALTWAAAGGREAAAALWSPRRPNSNPLRHVVYTGERQRLLG